MECSLELLERGLIVALQDLGAAGLTSSAAEMASKGEVGIDLDVAKVPLREQGMEPFEVMVSESQERMLCVVEPANVEAVMALCEKWEVNSAAIGTVTTTGRMRVFDGEELVGDMPVRALVDDCPLYDLRPEKPTAPIYAPPEATLARDAGLREALLALLASPNIASRRPLFEQYDAIVQSRTVRRPEQADAAVLALLDPCTSQAGESPPGQNGPIPALAVSIDCNGRRVAADPYTGTVEAVLECAANLACVGAEPLGTTNNLNFGNPEKGHIAWQLTESVRGLGDACRALEAPIVGGNVSLYNEGQTSGPIYPTPVIGMVGRLPDARKAGRLGFARPATRSRWWAPSPRGSRRASWRSYAARHCRTGSRRSTSKRSTPPSSPCAKQCARVSWRARTTSPRAARRSRWPSAAWPADWAPRSSWRRASTRSRPCSGRALAVSSSAVQSRACASWASERRCSMIGTVGGDALRIELGDESLSATLEELTDAHTSLRELFP